MRIAMRPRERFWWLENQKYLWAATRDWPLFAGGALDTDRDAP